MLKTTILVASGGFFGTAFRFLINSFVKTAPFPTTLFINIAGCFLIGLVMGASWKNAQWPLFLGAGFCGGFTTFSAFAMENLTLLEKGRYGTAALYILLSLVGGLLAAWIGFKMMNK